MPLGGLSGRQDTTNKLACKLEELGVLYTKELSMQPRDFLRWKVGSS